MKPRIWVQRTSAQLGTVMLATTAVVWGIRWNYNCGHINGPLLTFSIKKAVICECLVATQWTLVVWCHISLFP